MGWGCSSVLSSFRGVGEGMRANMAGVTSCLSVAFHALMTELSLYYIQLRNRTCYFGLTMERHTIKCYISIVYNSTSDWIHKELRL